MTYALPTEFDLSYHTEGLPDRNTYLTVASACLNKTLPGDLTGWIRVDLANPPGKVWFNDAEACRNGDASYARMAEHPIVVHQLAHPDSEPVLRGRSFQRCSE